MIEEKLKILGLNIYQSKAYIYLLKYGKSKASEISKNTKVPQSKIYETLEILEDKGLIFVVPEKINYYIAKGVEHLQEILSDKKKDLDNINKELEELKEISKSRNSGNITIVRGKKNFHKLLKEIPKAEKFSYTIRWNADVSDKNILKRSRELGLEGVERKTLFDYNCDKKNLEIWKKEIPDFNFINTDKVAMQINENSVMISIVDLNSTVLIKSKEFSDVMRQLYLGYYENN